MKKINVESCFQDFLKKVDPFFLQKNGDISELKRTYMAGFTAMLIIISEKTAFLDKTNGDEDIFLIHMMNQISIYWRKEQERSGLCVKV